MLPLDILGAILMKDPALLVWLEPPLKLLEELPMPLERLPESQKLFPLKRPPLDDGRTCEPPPWLLLMMLEGSGGRCDCLRRSIKVALSTFLQPKHLHILEQGILAS